MLIILDSSGVEIERVEDAPETSVTAEVELREPRLELGLAFVEPPESE